MPETTGKVYLIGAGPGDPTLLTLRGCELLQQADVVYYDYLVNPMILRHISESAEIHCLGSHSRGRVMSQADINERVVAAAQEGKLVVRLKGGDPSVFGRLAEEIASLEQAEVPYEVVPGVTTALAASSHAGIPLTHREHASCVAFITGQECREKDGNSIDLAALAKFPGTLVFYMGVTSAPDWAQGLMDHGKSAETPVAIIRHCSLPQQRTILTTLGQVPDVLAPRKMRPPAVIIVGEVLGTRSTMNWFTSRPLFGQKVLVTRPQHQSDGMLQRLTDLGATALEQPAIEITPALEPEALDNAIEHLHDFDWLVFSSANGVHYFMQRLKELGYDLRRLSRCQLAAIGPATSTALAKFHLVADLQPKEYRAEAQAEVLAPLTVGKRVLLLRASRGREVLAENLSQSGADVSQVVVYESRDVLKATPEIDALLEAGEIDWITITSSAIARSLANMFGEKLRLAKLAAISPLTAGVLEEQGFSVQIVASEYTTEGLIQAILGN